MPSQSTLKLENLSKQAMDFFLKIYFGFLRIQYQGSTCIKIIAALNRDIHLKHGNML